MNLLLLLTENEPVEWTTDEVHHNGQCVEHVMSGLYVNSSVGCLKCILGEVGCVFRCWNTAIYGKCSEHKSPIGEWNEKPIPIHVHCISNKTHQGHSQHYISHSLCTIYSSLLSQLLLSREILELLKLIVLLRVTLSCYVINIVWPVLPEVLKVYWIFTHSLFLSIYYKYFI